MIAATRRPLLLPHPLAEEINSLDAAKVGAITNPSHTVVLAGPGAGKTRLLVAKAAYLAATEVLPPQRIGCVTYATKAAEEVRRRLYALQPQAARAVTCATVHGFCLAEILTPFAAIAGFPPITAQSVIDGARQFELRVRAYDEAGLYEDPKWTEARDTACRRALYAGQPVAGFDHAVVAAAQAYDKLLADASVVDFEAMVGRSLQILRERPAVRRLIAARFPWLVVDEYQDLGPVLHGIVTTLRDAGTRIFAVGDPDQTILDFTGSDPRHLLELSHDPLFRVVRLHVNYRSGHVLVGAAATVLGENRGYQAHDADNAGTLDHRPIPGGINRHAEHAAKVVAELVDAGIPAHEIAVLYRRNSKKVPFRDWLVAAFKAAGLSTATERAQQWPRGRIVSFLQSIADWQLSRRTGRSNPHVRFDELAETYAALRTVAWHHVNARLAARVDLWTATNRDVEPTEDLPTWVAHLDRELDLMALLRRDVDAEESAALQQLSSAEWAAVTIAEFAGDVEAVGKVVLTTYHSAKGREWPYVVLAGLQEGVVPDWPQDYGRPYPPRATKIAEERRLFYVALTRARQAAILIYTPGAIHPPSFHISPSRFLAGLPGFTTP